MNNNTLSHIKRRSLVTAIACAYMSLVLSPAYASDTEIYVDSTNASAIAPNLMMLFDTSGSMQWCVDNAANSTCSDTDKRRINVLKKAMKQLLRGDAAEGISPAPGYIRMGLSRYHTTTASGGYVLYPARPLDAFVEISPTGTIESLLTDNNADAIQQFAQTTSGTSTSGALKVGLEGTTDYVTGLQFSNVRVPKGATITSAYLELTSNSSNVGLSTWEISAEAIGNANSYSTSQINSRTYGGIANYSPVAWSTNEIYKIPVTGAINEVVNRADWCGGNALSLRIRDIGAAKALRTAYSANTATSNDNKPKLVIKFAIDPESTNSCMKNVSKTTVLTVSNGNDDATWRSDGTSTFSNTSSTLKLNNVSLKTTNPNKGSVVYKTEAGILFTGVQIPKGATINSATLRITPNNNYSSVQDVLIYGFSSPDVAFCPLNVCITPAVAAALPLTSSNVLWNTPSDLYTNSSEVIDVKTIVQELVNKSAWDLNKTLGLKLWNNGSTSKNTAIFSFNGSSTKAPRLEIEWSIAELKQLTILETVRDQLEAAVDDLATPSGTPLGAAFSEATRYMYGMVPYNKSVDDYDSRVVTNGGTSSVQYISPISNDDNCSANYVFLLTDGEPLDDANVAANVKGVTANTTSCSGSPTAIKNWNCMKELAAYNNTISTKSGAPKKRIYTSTMVLGPLPSAETYMAEIANLGGGKPYKATDTGALVAAFSDVVNEAMKASGTISAAGVAVNQLNRLNHLDQLYYAVFDPRPNSLHWDGNLKRYKLGNDGSTIYDNSASPQNAIDSETGFFQKNAKSFWSTAVDGDVASEGGAASKLPVPTARKMFTYTGSLSALSSPVSLTEMDLTNTDFTTYAQTKTGTTGTQFTNLINWYKGYDLASLNGTLDTTMLRKRLGGALHSRPILINYGYTGGIENAANPINQTNYVFFSTLEGTLHAIDANTGVEKFSFIPGEKLPRLKELFLNPASALPEFGLDLTWVYYRKDGDYSGQIDTTSASKDKIWLYGGMRMGGDDYYALDVTDINNPKLMFAIDGGSVGKYAKMGQTWSEPVITSIYVAGKPTKVMIFGGGYDEKHENHNLALPFADIDKGNQVYIVDAEKGTLLWMTSGNASDNADKYVADMKFSIPSSPKAIDLDGDGVTDVLYVGDLGGQVFRIDLDKNAATNANIAKRVRLLAKVGQTETATLANQRRFYEPPAVATFKDSAGQLFATVAMGSGYRSRPLNAITNERFYTFFDKDVVRSNLTTMADADLQPTITTSTLAELDLTSTAIQQNGVNVTNKQGWYIDYPEAGEKSLASGFIYNSRLVFSTYSPTQLITSNCSPVKGQTNLYTVCMPYGNLCSTTTAANGFTGYKKSNTVAGLGGEPQLMVFIDADGKLKLTVNLGTKFESGIFEDVDVNQAKLVPSKKWREKTRKD